MALRAVTFDLWQTLLFDTPETERRRNALRVQDTERMLRAWGQPYSLDHITAAWEQARRLWADARRLGAELSSRQKLVTFLAAIDERLLTILTPRQLEELAMAHAQAFMKAPPAVAPGAGEVVRGLTNAGLRLGVISNTSVTPGFAIRRLLQAAGFGSYFSAFTFSDELGAGKPARAVFQVTLHRLAVEPGEAVHVGDDPALDLLGAKAAGMRVVLLSFVDVPPGVPQPDARAADLFEVGRIIAELAEIEGAGAGELRTPRGAGP